MRVSSVIVNYIVQVSTRGRVRQLGLLKRDCSDFRIHFGIIKVIMNTMA